MLVIAKRSDGACEYYKQYEDIKEVKICILDIQLKERNDELHVIPKQYFDTIKIVEEK